MLSNMRMGKTSGQG